MAQQYADGRQSDKSCLFQSMHDVNLYILRQSPPIPQARINAWRIRKIVSSIGARLDTSNPNCRAITFTLAGFKGTPPRSMAAIKARAFRTSGKASTGSSLNTEANRWIKNWVIDIPHSSTPHPKA